MLDFKKLRFLVCTAICFIGCFKNHKNLVVFAQLCDTQLGMSNYEKDKESFSKFCNTSIHSSKKFKMINFLEIL